jgi:hypothetical protein
MGERHATARCRRRWRLASALTATVLAAGLGAPNALAGVGLPASSLSTSSVAQPVTSNVGNSLDPVTKPVSSVETPAPAQATPVDRTVEQAASTASAPIEATQKAVEVRRTRSVLLASAW